MKLSRPQPARLPLGPLPQFSPDEARLWNWFCRSFPKEQDWRAWITETFGRNLAHRASSVLTLSKTNRTQPGISESKFNQPEIRLGRGTENDLQLTGASISKQHARLFTRDETYFVEDLGSVLGTYLNEKKLVPQEPAQVRSGDQLVIFPYTFTIKIEPVWVPESTVHLYTGAITPSSWGDFFRNAPLGVATFLVTAHPTGKCACLQVDLSFVRTITDRAVAALTPASPGAPVSNDALLETLLLSILQTANKRLAYPFQFGLSRFSSDFPQERQGRGLSILLSVGLSDVTGGFRIFVPYDFLTLMSETKAGLTETKLPETITWAFPVTCGSLTLTLDDVRQLETDDVVIFDRNPQLLFPKNFDQGWNISFAEGNSSRARIDKYCERETIMGTLGAENNEGASEQGVNLGSLPVLLHVIVGEKEMTLSEANGLAPGTILDLNRDMSNTVQLALNGKIVGQGQLVEIDSRLGVRIGKWSAS
jgi:type III secretion system YscQ/HrcQ family protein